MSNTGKNKGEYNSENLEEITYGNEKVDLSIAEDETHVKLSNILPDFENNYDGMLSILDNFMSGTHASFDIDQGKQLIFFNEKLKEKGRIDNDKYSEVKERIERVAKDNDINLNEKS